MVLIEVRNSQGIVGRCDAKCYNAKTPGCECICNGKNHGAGLKQAQDNTKEMAEQWIEAYAESKGLVHYEGRVNEQVYQLGLFDRYNINEKVRSKTAV